MAQQNYNIRDIPGYEGKYAVTADGRVVRFMKLTTTSKGYKKATLNKQAQGVHRLVFSTYLGVIPENMQIDHINRIAGDNRVENLRLCTGSQNKANKRKGGRAPTSKYKGVCLSFGKWRAQIGHRGEVISIGTFDTELEAARAYDKYALALYKEFALLNEV